MSSTASSGSPPDRRGSTAATSGKVPTGNPIARHPLVAFFVIAYAVAWSFWPFGSFGAFGPLVAALIVVPLSRRPSRTPGVGIEADPLARALGLVRARAWGSAGGGAGHARGWSWLRG